MQLQTKCQPVPGDTGTLQGILHLQGTRGSLQQRAAPSRVREPKGGLWKSLQVQVRRR